MWLLGESRLCPHGGANHLHHQWLFPSVPPMQTLPLRRGPVALVSLCAPVLPLSPFSALSPGLRAAMASAAVTATPVTGDSVGGGGW